MKYLVSKDDYRFKERVEKLNFPVEDFDHRAHLRLAYIYLAGNTVIESVELMRSTLCGLLKHAGIEPIEKYHETLTQAWILAVFHFMNCSGGSESSEVFLKENSILLDSKIMNTHYSNEVLFSESARIKFVEPNLGEIPRYAA